LSSRLKCQQENKCHDNSEYLVTKGDEGFRREATQRGGYSTASEYVRDLIRDAQKRAAQQKLEKLLLEGLDSEPPIRVDDDFWKRKREKLIRSVRKQKTHK
jgi:antitoxin ParD1/3/4